MIRDSRNQKWSFPKGGVEESDPFQLATGIREVYEETGFQYMKDYSVDLTKKPDIIGSCALYEGHGFHNDLIFSQKLYEHVEEVAWIPKNKVCELEKNYSTKWYCDNKLKA